MLKKIVSVLSFFIISSSIVSAASNDLTEEDLDWEAAMKYEVEYQNLTEKLYIKLFLDDVVDAPTHEYRMHIEVDEKEYVTYIEYDKGDDELYAEYEIDSVGNAFHTAFELGYVVVKKILGEEEETIARRKLEIIPHSESLTIGQEKNFKNTQENISEKIDEYEEVGDEKGENSENFPHSVDELSEERKKMIQDILEKYAENMFEKYSYSLTLKKLENTLEIFQNFSEENSEFRVIIEYAIEVLKEVIYENK